MSVRDWSAPALTLIQTDGSQVDYSWEDYAERSADMMRVLYQRGIRKGDFVAIIALNLPESFFAILGTIVLGAVPVPINAPLIKEPGQKDLGLILNDCKPKLVIANACLDEYLTDIEHVSFEELLSKNDGEDLVSPDTEWPNNPKQLMIMPYTSGTTGGPKGAMLTRENIMNRIDAITEELCILPEERLLSYLSLGHISELIATFFGQLKSRYHVYFTEYAKEVVRDREKFRHAFPAVLQAVKPTVFLAVPKVWANIRKEIEKKTRFIPLDLGRRGFFRDIVVDKIKNRLGLRETKKFISAGSKFSSEDRQFFARLGIEIDDVYGQTETAGPLTLNGKPIGDTSVTRGENDEILVKGPNVMLGYYNRPEATAKVLENGTFRTGDVGLWHNSGQVSCGGRLDDGYKNSQGEFVSPEKIEELEEAVRKIDGVDEVVVCGAGKPYNVALVFSAKPCKELHKKLESKITKIGQGMYRIKKFLLINSEELEFTPTLKIKKKKMLKKFESQISKL